MASGGKGSSPYVGVQKSKSGGFFVERRHFEYQGEKYGKKFFHRTKDEEEAAFISDFVNHFKGNNKSTFNFENSRKVLEEHDSRLRQELEESFAWCTWLVLDPKFRKKELRKSFIDEAEKLWNEYKGEILKDHIRPSHKGSKNNVVEQLNHGHEDSVQKHDHIRPSHMGSKNNVVEQLNHGHEDSVQEQDHIRSLHNGSRNITLEQLNHGYENRLAGECSMTKQTEECVSNMTKQTEERVSNMIKQTEERVSNMTKQTEEHVSNMTKQTGEHGGPPKFDVDVGLLAQAHEEPVLKKKLPLPPSLEKDPESSCSQTQEDPNEGTDARGQNTEPNQENKMEIRRDGYKKYVEISDKFLKSECSFLVDTAIPKVSAQIQCALYEKIYDAVNVIIDSECISKEKLDKYWAETEPILKQCRANWHS